MYCSNNVRMTVMNMHNRHNISKLIFINIYRHTVQVAMHTHVHIRKCTYTHGTAIWWLLATHTCTHAHTAQHNKATYNINTSAYSTATRTYNFYVGRHLACRDSTAHIYIYIYIYIYIQNLSTDKVDSYLV